MVTDFGISKVFSNPPVEATMNRYTQHACGSLPYMAPELVIVSKRFSMFRRPTYASDIWSLAATLTEMFTGRHLYGSVVPDVCTLTNLKASPDLPQSIREASPALRAVFGTSLEGRPELRPKSCKDILRLIELHLVGMDADDSSDSEV